MQYVGGNDYDFYDNPCGDVSWKDYTVNEWVETYEGGTAYNYDVFVAEGECPKSGSGDSGLGLLIRVLVGLVVAVIL